MASRLRGASSMTACPMRSPTRCGVAHPRTAASVLAVEIGAKANLAKVKPSGNPSSPVPQRRLPERQGGDRGGVGAQDTRAKRHRGDEWEVAQAVAFGGIEAAFRTDQDGPALPLPEGEGVGGGGPH